MFGSDNKPINWEEAVKLAGKSEKLKKIFFIQACQGKGLGVLVSDGPDEIQ